MKTQIKNISIYQYSNYSKVIVQDIFDSEFVLNFKRDITENEVIKDWNEYGLKTWRII